MHFGNLEKNKRKETLVLKEFNMIKLKEENEDLEEEEARKKRELQGDFWSVVACNESLIKQKSRVKWILEGDHNSKFFSLICQLEEKEEWLKGLKYRGGVG